MSDPNVVATFTDRYGDERAIHKTRAGLKVLRQKSTTILALNRAVAPLIGQKVKAKRLERGLELAELARMAGITADPKHRMWAIENAIRGEGIRMGTLYALALALDCDVTDLLPTVAEAKKAIKVRKVPGHTLEVE